MTLDYDDDLRLVTFFNHAPVAKRAVAELCGMAAVIVYDGKVSDDEISVLLGWLKQYGWLREEWPVSELVVLFEGILEDGEVDRVERLQLLRFLTAIAPSWEHPAGTASASIFDRAPAVVLEGRSFLITGELRMTKRRHAYDLITKLGGVQAKSPHRDLDYLVVGELGSGNWKHSRFGTKIQRVMDNRSAGCHTQIIREGTLARAIVDGAAPDDAC